MFGFSKKKENESASPASGQMQTSKIEDDMASFEIPDFSDDDLNFDLGIGEFMPKGGLNPQMPVQGLPVNPAEKPNPDEIPPMPFPPGANADTNSQTPQIPQLNETKEVKETDEKKEDEEENASDDYESTLPKFSNAGSFDLSEIAEEEAEPKKTKAVRAHKDASEIGRKVHVRKNEPKHYAQSSPEGYFVPKEVYQKIVVLSDDVSKKTIQGDEISRGIHSLSKTTKEIIFDADKDAKAVRDLMLSADLMLFGGK